MSSDSADYGTACREVDWYAVAVFAESLLTRFDRLPTPGTPSWSALSDRDPVKLAAVISVARFWAFDASCRQDAEIQASHAVSAAADWGAISRYLRDEADFYRRALYLKRIPRHDR